MFARGAYTTKAAVPHVRHAGFTVVETLVALGIGLALVAVSLAAFGSFRDYFALRTAALDVHTALIDARTASLSARNDTVHGVHVESGQVVRFEGSTYSAGAATNRAYPFSYGVTAAFSGGSSNIVFTRLSGRAQTSGTITLTEPRSGRTATVTVYDSGLIEL